MKAARPYQTLVIFGLILISLATHAADFTGRFAMFGSTAQGTQNQVFTADQQTLRLMLDQASGDNEWSLHLRTLRQTLTGNAALVAQTRSIAHSTDLFRYQSLADNGLNQQTSQSLTRVGYELDRAVYKHRFASFNLAIGRQAIDWGTGRFWQPLNVFGAFAPTDLDTDYKPGIDVVALNAYPSNLSNLTAVYAFAPKDNPHRENSAALHYQTQVGQNSELTLQASQVIGNQGIGAAYESDLFGLNFRLEGLYQQLKTSHKKALFWITGIDYQFSDSTILSAELYQNSLGADTEAGLASLLTTPLVIYGLQPQLSRHLIGLSIQKDLSPLWHGSYLLMVSALKDARQSLQTSTLQQFVLSYSISNEADLLLSALFPNGKGLNALQQPQSEFGGLPTTASVRLRFYF